MADPKYAELPGIVYDQPDVYETSELPESEQDITEIDVGDSSQCVEVLQMSGAEAHAMFKGKCLDASLVDFSDKISRTPRNGYAIRNVEWEMAGKDEPENVVQKYQRLKCEVNELVQEAQEIKEDIDCKKGKMSSLELNKQVDSLHKLLLGMNLEDTLGQEVMSSIVQPQQALQKKLMTLMESFEKTGLVSSKEQPKASIADGKDCITYELYYSPEHAKLNQLAKAAHLEKRLDKLEILIGNNPDKMSVLSTWTNHKDILGALLVLSSRLSLLEPTHLDHIEGRLHAVHTRINNMAEKKAVVADADKQSKVSELYDIMKKCEVLCCALPEVVDRLVCVEGLHQQAVEFSRGVKQLDVAQTQLSGVLQGNAQLLNAVQQKFAANLSTIQANTTALDQRIQKLQLQKK